MVRAKTVARQQQAPTDWMGCDHVGTTTDMQATMEELCFLCVVRAERIQESASVAADQNSRSRQSRRLSVTLHVL
jgi:hypothetical protein